MYSTKNEYMWEIVKQQLDEFAVFTWRAQSSTDHNMFIINENREGLKFFNGGGFSNEYSNPKYQKNNADLLGINFNRQTINFKVAIYDVTITEYQNILAWLDPTIIDYLTFDYDKDYGYLVKLSDFQDSTRYIIGRRNNEPTYYTELELKWDVQGPQCVRAISPSIITWKDTEISLDGTKTELIAVLKQDKHQSFLDAPITLSLPFFPQQDKCQISLTAILYKDNHKIAETKCFDISFQNTASTKESMINLTAEQKKVQSIMSISYSQNAVSKITLRYDSETGLCFVSGGSSFNWKLLNFLTTNENSGDPLVQDMNSNYFSIPGTNRYQHLDEWDEIKFYFELHNCTVSLKNQQPLEISLETYKRKMIS